VCGKEHSGDKEEQAFGKEDEPVVSQGEGRKSALSKEQK
jgi:hypothetical protein